MPIFTADFILTSKGLQPDCLLHVADDGEILALERNVSDIPDAALSLSGIICPGFINAHCHLELSHLEGKIPRGTGLAGFASKLMSIRNEVSEADRQAAMAAAQKRMKVSGTVAVGDISNSAESFSLKQENKLRYHTFIELLGLLPERAEPALNRGKELLAQAPTSNGNSAGFAPHAPYSVSPELFSLIMAFEGDQSGISSFHIQESREEDEFFQTGTGPLLDLYEQIGLDISGWKPPQKSSMDVFRPLVKNGVRIIFVHNTFTTASQAKEAIRLHPDPYFCICLKANLYIEQSMPDLLGLIDTGARLCLGTDSLASNDSLSIFEEMKTIQRHFPQVSTETLLKWATLNGAMALGFGKELGSFVRGKKPGVNLVSGLDSDSLKITANSTVRVLV